MKISIILAHPNKSSLNHAIAKVAAETLLKDGHSVIWHDLYEENFDPVIPGEEIYKNAYLEPAIERHCAEIAAADGIIIVHPNWWGEPPAIMKGWIDRVIRPGVAYEFIPEDKGEGIPKGLLRAKAALVFNTSDTPPEREMRSFGDPLETIWKNCIFSLCGVNNFYRINFAVVVTSTQEQRKKWLEEVRGITNRYFPK